MFEISWHITLLKIGPYFLIILYSPVLVLHLLLLLQLLLFSLALQPRTGYGLLVTGCFLITLALHII
jgi:hypothetical protein